jgi:uncharacterized membrane protein
MNSNGKETEVCQVCGQKMALGDLWPGYLVKGGVLETIKRKHPQWSEEGYICLTDLNRLRGEYVEDVLEEHLGEAASLEKGFLESLKEQELVSRNINVAYEEKLTFWQRLSDKVAEFGGSWPFVLSLMGAIVLWMVVNSLLWLLRPFDPYPYIFLNLVLSALAGLQAPVILMSQNRQDAKDRLRSEYDYHLNLKAELEIRHLHEKLDLLLTNQWRRLLEIQRIQMEVMEELAGKAPGKPGRS